MQESGSASSSERQRSSIESFLDEYQAVRLYLNVAALVVVAVFYIGGWADAASILPSVVILGLLAGHAGWCRFRQVRAPMTMLSMDTTLLGAIMFTMPDTPSTMTGIFGFLALIVVLFSAGRWMAGFLAYLSGWYVAAFVNGSGISADSIGALVGNLFAVAALVVVMVRVRGWLERLDAGRSQMIGTVSHELRNNLTGVMGLTEIVSTMSELEPVEARELIAMAHQQAVDASDIVEDLLTASRLEASALSVSFGEVDVNAEVGTVAGRFHDTDNEIELELANDLPPAWADGLRVRQTIRNLLSNAIRYGGPVISMITRRVGDTIEIMVRDNGEGVPEEEEATIFLPYRRSTQGRRDDFSIGLGLWICRHLVQEMGGKLQYLRHDGLTDFILTIPTTSPDQESDTAKAGTPALGRTAARTRPAS